MSESVLELICKYCLNGKITDERPDKVFCAIDREYLKPTDTCFDIVPVDVGYG